MMKSRIWDTCEDCGSTDLIFTNERTADKLTYVECRNCGEDWYDTYEGMWE